jgi:hypothetical protein
MPSISTLLASNPNSFTSFLQGITSRVFPTKIADNVQQSPRMTPYGEFGVANYMNDVYPVADEGQYFAIVNPTLGTGIATIAAADAYDPLETYILLQNMEPIGGKRVYLDFLRLLCTGAGTNGTNLHFSTAIDGCVSRYTSGDALASQPKNVNMDSNNRSCVQAYAGPLITTAASANVRYLDNGKVRLVIPVVGDSYQFNFGSKAGGNGGLITSGTTQCSLIFTHVPVIIGPQQSFLFSLWGTSQSAGPAFTISFGWWER